MPFCARIVGLKVTFGLLSFECEGGVGGSPVSRPCAAKGGSRGELGRVLSGYGEFSVGKDGDSKVAIVFPASFDGV